MYEELHAVLRISRLFRFNTGTELQNHSDSRRVGESFFDSEYLREFEAEIGTARKIVGLMRNRFLQKTQKIPPHCHVPLNE
jgi:hypothetical protein